MNNNIRGFHGSDIERVADYYKIDKNCIINYASNVNPLGLPKSAHDALPTLDAVISRYPDRDYASLKRTISNYTNTNKKYITVGNGSTELISLLIHLQMPKKALVIRPTYSEYERELSMVGSEIEAYFLNDSESFSLNIDGFMSHLDSSIDMVVFCNPNNPTANAISTSDLKRIIKACDEYDIFLLIDETYAEFAPTDMNVSALPLIEEFDNFMVIRGASKLFCAPGLRFGYAITSNDAFIKHLRKDQNPWSLNSVGAYLGEIMLKDTQFIAETSNLISTERLRIMDSF
ncbi:MAG: pyridoxal phosphate-dependent aminotransferase, partial [Suipraeoptans sp.]